MAREEKLGGLPYLGGKSGRSNTGTGRWIAGLLPYRHYYVEPFGGMMGVLLQRRKSKVEVYNDLNKNLLDWWTAVREIPGELAERLEITPQSRALFEECIDKMREGNPGDLLERAWRVHVIYTAKMPTARDEKTGFAWTKTDYKKGSWPHHRFEALGRRISDVVLECRDANVIMETMRNREDLVMYVDPPYRSSVTHAKLPYGLPDVDWDRMLKALAAQKGLVAVSGYNDEWDDLGWHRIERPTFTSVAKSAQKRTEVLWTNFALTASRGGGLSSWTPGD